MTHGERLEALAAQLDGLAARYETERDSRCVFTHAYAFMTRRLATDLAGAGVRDPDWVVRLAEEFGRLYIDAATGWDDDRARVPDGWSAVFETICPKRTSPLEDLVLPMAAHLIRDLPHALIAVELADADGRSHIDDFHALNAILGHTVDDMQAEIGERYAHYLRWLDRVGRAHDELLSNYGMRMTRGMAWYNALRMQEDRAAAVSIEKSPRDFAREIMRQPLLRVLRLMVHSLRRWPAAQRVPT